MDPNRLVSQTITDLNQHCFKKDAEGLAWLRLIKLNKLFIKITGMLKNRIKWHIIYVIILHNGSKVIKWLKVAHKREGS